jgi:hypothetical protein
MNGGRFKIAVDSRPLTSCSSRPRIGAPPSGNLPLPQSDARRLSSGVGWLTFIMATKDIMFEIEHGIPIPSRGASNQQVARAGEHEDDILKPCSPSHVLLHMCRRVRFLFSLARVVPHSKNSKRKKRATTKCPLPFFSLLLGRAARIIVFVPF